ncbi:hypothetical protein IAT40_004701 [Kwoniella sp. CBS 6097]
MEGYSVHAPRRPKIPTSDDDIQLIQGRQGSHQSGLPQDKMQAVKATFNARNVQTRSKQRDGPASTMPFTPGRNTMDKSGPSRQHLRESRASLAPGHNHEVRQSQPAQPVASAGSSKPRVPLGSPVDRQPPQPSNNIRQSHASSSRLPSRSASPVQEPPPTRGEQGGSDFQLLATTFVRLRTRNSSLTKNPAIAGPSQSGQAPRQQPRRSASPVKPPSSGTRNTHNPFPHQSSPVQQASFDRSAKGKGKAKEDLRTDRAYHEVIDSDSDSNGRELSADVIKNPDNLFHNEIGDDVEFVETEKPASSKPYAKGTSGRIQPTDDPPPSTPGRGLKSAKNMKGRDGNVHNQQSDVIGPSRPKKQQQATIPPSLAHRDRSADCNRLWITPDHILKCDYLRYEKDRLKLVLNVGPSSKWWEIEFDTINWAQICTSKDHPFMMLVLHSVQKRSIETIDFMSQRPVLPNLSGGVTLCVELLSLSDSSATLLKELENKLKAIHVHTERLDFQACLAIRSSCNVQSRDTRTQAKRRESARRQSLAESEQSELANEIKVTGRSMKSEDKDDGRPKTKASAKDKAKDPNQSTLNFQSKKEEARSLPSRKSNRLSGAKPLYDPEVSVTPQPNNVISQRLAKSGADKNDLLFAYPPTGRADVNVTYGDAQRVETGEFLNDTLLEFGLRHVLRGLHEEKRQSVHLFNSFFYDKLSNKSKKAQSGEDSWPAYETVKKWSKGKNIFDKKFVVVPINENYHWYLAVIVNPGGVLRREENAIIDTNQQTTAQTPTTENRSRSRSTSARDPTPPTKRQDSDLDDLDSEPENGDVTADPLDCIDEETKGDPVVTRGRGPDSTSSSVPEVSQGVKDLSLQEEKNTGGSYLWTPTMAAVASQNDHSKEDPQPADKSTGKKGKPRGPDAEILGSKGAWIITFDSLGGSHKAVANTLNAWLKYEARDKLQITHELEEASYWEGRVPAQNNFSDCGLYLVHYTKQLLERPETVLSFVQIQPYKRFTDGWQEWIKNLETSWRAEQTSNMREQWCDMMIGLATEYSAARELARNDPNQKKDEESEDEHEAAQEGFVNGSQDDSIAALPASQFQREQQRQQERGSSAPTTTGEGGPDKTDASIPDDEAEVEVSMPGAGAFPTDTEEAKRSKTKSRSRSRSKSKPKSTSSDVLPPPMSIPAGEVPSTNTDDDFDPALTTHSDMEVEKAMPLQSTHLRFLSSPPASRMFSNTDDEDNRDELVDFDEHEPMGVVNGQTPTPNRAYNTRSRADSNVSRQTLSPEKQPDFSIASVHTPHGKTKIPAGNVKKRVSEFDPLLQLAQKVRKVETDADTIEEHVSEQKQRRLAEVQHLRPAGRHALGEIRLASDSSALTPQSASSDNEASVINAAAILSPPADVRAPNLSASVTASAPSRIGSSPFTSLSKSGPRAGSPPEPSRNGNSHISAPLIGTSSHQDDTPYRLASEKSRAEEAASDSEAGLSDSASEEIAVSQERAHDISIEDFDSELSATARTQNRISLSDALHSAFQDTPTKASRRIPRSAVPIDLALSQDDELEEEPEPIEYHTKPASGSSPLTPRRTAGPRLGMNPRPITYSGKKGKGRIGQGHQDNEGSARRCTDIRRQPPGHRQNGSYPGSGQMLAPVFTQNQKNGFTHAQEGEDHGGGGSGGGGGRSTSSTTNKNKRARSSLGASVGPAGNGTRKEAKQARYGESALTRGNLKGKGRERGSNVEVISVDSDSDVDPNSV